VIIPERHSYLANVASRNVIVGCCYHKDGLGIAHACFHELDICDAAREDFDVLVVDDLGDQFVQFGDVATVSIDLVIGGFEQVLYQSCTTVARGAEDSVGRHGVSCDDENRRKQLPASLHTARLFIHAETMGMESFQDGRPQARNSGRGEYT
jgi:hypothetical protein